MSNFKKSDLRTGMKVTLRNGNEYIVLLNAKHNFSTDTNLLISLPTNEDECDWLLLDDYTEELLDKDSRWSRFDIVKVEMCEHLGHLFTNKLRFSPIQREMTLEEIEKEIGCKIKLKPNN